jgi:hypothetical protein
VLAACQLVDRAAAPGGGKRGSAVAVPLGAPEQQSPQTLGELLDRADRAAEQWQDGAAIVAVFIDLEQGRWRSGEVTYVAPDSDHFLRVVASSKGIEQFRPTLATLSLRPIDEPSLVQIPPLPKRVLDPTVLLAAAFWLPPHPPSPTAASIHARVKCSTPPVPPSPGSPLDQRLTWTVTISDAARLLVEPASGKPARPDACRPLSGR